MKASLIAALAGVILIPESKIHAAPKKIEIAGKADVLRHVPKKFGKLVNIDVANHRVEFRQDGEKQTRTWNILPDAELKVHGSWGRLSQFSIDDRVWVWFAVDRKKQPTAVLFMTDESTEKSIHEPLEKWKSREEREQFITLQKKQIEFLRNDWRKNGLPGTVTMLHPIGGEMELTLDHEAMRWGRWLKTADAVTIATKNPIRAVVKSVEPWRERTRLRLVTNSGLDQGDLSVGQRIALKVTEPPPAVQASSLPTDIGRLQANQDRIDWLLASSYCSCGITGDKCTGMVYTLASCNVNACGMPNQIRGKAARMIDEGLTDEQIWVALTKERGPMFVRQHLLK